MAKNGRVDPVWQRAILKLYTAAKSFKSLRASFWIWQNDPAGFQSSGMWLALARPNRYHLAGFGSSGVSVVSSDGQAGRARFALPRGPENELAPAGPLAHPLLAAWLDPVGLIAALDLAAQGTGIYPFLDRKALILEASLRDPWRADSVGLLPWEYVGYSEPTSYEIWVDDEKGLVLQLTAIQAGQAFYQFQVADLVLDLEFPAGYFEFDPPESALPKLEFTFQGQRQPPGSRFREAEQE